MLIQQLKELHEFWIIDTSARIAKKLGYDITLISDTGTTKNLFWNNMEIYADAVHQVFMASLQNSFADIKNTAKFLSSITNKNIYYVKRASSIYLSLLFNHLKLDTFYHFYIHNILLYILYSYITIIEILNFTIFT